MANKNKQKQTTESEEVKLSSEETYRLQAVFNDISVTDLNRNTADFVYGIEDNLRKYIGVDYVDSHFKATKQERKELKEYFEWADNYIGSFSLATIGNDFFEKMLEKWVRLSPITDGLIKDRKRLFTRLLTKKEFDEVLNDAYDERLDEIARMADVKDVVADKEKRSLSSMYKTYTSKNEALIAFYHKHIAYAFFNIKTGKDRRKFAQIFGEDDSYLQAMTVANRYLMGFFLAWRTFRIPEKARRMHTYIVAGTGKGKSELLKSFIWLDILRKKSSVIVLDPNGDFAEQIARFKEHEKKEFADRLIYIDPYLKSGFIPVINPLEMPSLTPDYISGARMEIFDLLIQVFKELSIVVTGNMESILMNVLYVLCEKPNTTLKDLSRFMDGRRNEDLVKFGQTCSDAEVRNYFLHEFQEKNLRISKDGLKPKLTRILSSGKFKALTCGKTTIDLKKAMDEKKIIVFNLSKGKMQSASLLYGRFVLNYILNIGTARAFIPKEERVPCHLYIDEFHDYKSDKLSEVFTQGRKYKIYLTVATQVVGQGLSADMSSTILGNTNIKIIGGSARKTRSDMAKEMELSDKDVRTMTGVDEKTLRELGIGEFVVKIDNKYPFKMVNRVKLLDNRHSMKPKKWEKLIEQQVKAYYTPIVVDDYDAQAQSPPSQNEQKTPQSNQSGDNAQQSTGKKKFNSKYKL